MLSGFSLRGVGSILCSLSLPLVRGATFAGKSGRKQVAENDPTRTARSRIRFVALLNFSSACVLAHRKSTLDGGTYLQWYACMYGWMYLCAYVCVHVFVGINWPTGSI